MRSNASPANRFQPPRPPRRESPLRLWISLVIGSVCLAIGIVLLNSPSAPTLTVGSLVTLYGLYQAGDSLSRLCAYGVRLIRARRRTGFHRYHRNNGRDHPGRFVHAPPVPTG